LQLKNIIFQIDDCWWKGTVHKVEPHEGSKKSPFLSIYVHWDNNEKEYLSPWDLEALDSDTADIEDGTPVTIEQIRSSLYVPSSEEWNSIGRDSECQRIAEALESIMSLAIAEPFNYPVDTTIYPEYIFDVEYPVDLTMIKSRVENHFYRRIDAILFDLKFIFDNAKR
jgi:bromodomain and WD repeat domain-containing protein 1/3